MNRLLNSSKKSNYFAKLIELQETETDIILIFEYIKGETLQKIIKEGELTGGEVRSIMTLLLRILKVLDEHEIVHRDLKPDNIIIQRKIWRTKNWKYSEFKSIKLIDFGLCCFKFSKKKKDLRRVGTSGYIAPECYLFKTGEDFISILNGRLDIFSLGAIMYFMLFRKELNFLTEDGKIEVSKNYQLFIEHDDVVGGMDRDKFCFLGKLLDVDFFERISASEALDHLYILLIE